MQIKDLCPILDPQTLIIIKDHKFKDFAENKSKVNPEFFNREITSLHVYENILIIVIKEELNR